MPQYRLRKGFLMKRVKSGLLTGFVFLIILISSCFHYDWEDGDTRLHPDSTERVCLLASQNWDPELDAQSDVVILEYTAADKIVTANAASWSRQKYQIHAKYVPGKYSASDYAAVKNIPSATAQAFQQDQNGKIIFDSGYYFPVPVSPPSEQFKKLLEHALADSVRAIQLESALYADRAGFSPKFKSEWEKFYKQAWINPFSSADAYFQSNRLKRELLYRATAGLLKATQRFMDEKKVPPFACYLKIPSLFSAARRNFITPITQVTGLPQVNGFIGIIEYETGEIRPPKNLPAQPDIFEQAYFDAGFFKNTIRQTGKKLWLELRANPTVRKSHSKLYLANFQRALTAALMQYEIKGLVLEAESALQFQQKRKGSLPANFATQLQVAINIGRQLHGISPLNYVWLSGTRHIGVLVSDALLDQAGYPAQQDSELQSVYFPALSMLRHGMPVEMVNLDRCTNFDYLRTYRILFLSYEAQRPSSPELHSILEKWIDAGGVLIFQDAPVDSFNFPGSWWRKDKKKYLQAQQHLFDQLGLPQNPQPGIYEYGKGALIYDPQPCSKLALEDKGSQKICQHVLQAIRFIENDNYHYKIQNYLYIHRGPFIIAAVFKNSLSEKALEIPGIFIDCLPPEMPLIDKKMIQPGDVGILFNVKKMEKIFSKVLISHSSIRDEQADGNNLSFISRGMAGITCHTLIKLVAMPPEIKLTTRSGQSVSCEIQWYPKEHLLRLIYENRGEDILVALNW